MNLLIDGNNLVWRSSSQVVLSHNGRNTEVAFIGAKQLMSYINKFKPEDILVVWDGGHDERRKALYPDYKKKREYTEEEELDFKAFYEQVHDFRMFLTAISIKQMQCRGREADDVIATLVEEEIMGENICIISNDEDYVQLLRDGVKLYFPKKKELLTKEIYEAEMGFPVKEYPTYKAMIGGHDNIPGIKGIGSVGAKAVMQYITASGTPIEPIGRAGKALNLFDARDTDFSDMVKVCKFMKISLLELSAGEIPAVDPESIEDWEDNAKRVLKFFGFKSWLEHFDIMFKPVFEKIAMV